MKLFNRIKKWWKPDAFTQEWIHHTDKPEVEIKCFKNGEYIHTVTLMCFTEEQIKKFKEL